jgi:predicted nucleic acid-binding protein
VEELLADGEACWCPVVRLELWNGAGGERDRKVLREFETALSELPIGSDVWTASFDLARRARARGITVPATDLLIAACARVHGVGIEAADADFAAIEQV